MMPETEFILYGISKQSYKFKVYPINIELPSDFGGLYVYTNYTSNGRELIYGGRSVNIPSRHGDASSSLGWEVDHIKPIKDGGSNEFSNLRPLKISKNRGR